MHVIFGHHGQVVVHDVVDLRHVDAAGEHVGGDEHVGLALAEIGQRAATLGLAAVGVNGLGGNADAAKALAAVVGAALGAGEHDNAVAAFFLDEGVEQLGLLATRCFNHVLVDFVGRFAAVGDFDNRGVVQNAEHGFVLAAVDGRREQQRLAVFGRGLDNALDLGPKAHVEHAVGLVENEHLNLREVGGAALHKVDHAAGGHDGHVETALELLDLRAVCHAAHERAHEVVRVLADGHARVSDLAGQLAGGGHDEHEGAAVVAFAMAQLVHGGKRERSGFARAGFCGGDEVAALEHQRNGLLLNGGCIGVAEGVNGFKGLLGKAELSERSNDVLLWSGALTRCELNARSHVARGERACGRKGCVRSRFCGHGGRCVRSRRATCESYGQRVAKCQAA